MRNILISYTIGFMFAATIMVPAFINIDSKYKSMRKERDMYNKLYRTANTNLMHFQDSINKYCICR